MPSPRLAPSIVAAALACGTPSAAPMQPLERPPTQPQPRPPVVVEREPAHAQTEAEAELAKPTPTNNTAAALIAGATAITAIHVHDAETGERVASLAPELVAELRRALAGAEVSEGLSMQPSWSIVLLVEIAGRGEPIVAQFVDLALRVKPEDAWSSLIVDEDGEIDWRIHEIPIEPELGLDLALAEHGSAPNLFERERHPDPSRRADPSGLENPFGR